MAQNKLFIYKGKTFMSYYQLEKEMGIPRKQFNIDTRK
ncbi:Uncharacterised protein [Enterococcus mundtii]|nr:Uncharacterised protein [Enterococcus mundtii]